MDRLRGFMRYLVDKGMVDIDRLGDQVTNSMKETNKLLEAFHTWEPTEESQEIQRKYSMLVSPLLLATRDACSAKDAEEEHVIMLFAKLFMLGYFLAMKDNQVFHKEN